MKIKKMVLAYSGGLDTSVIIKWLKEKYECEIIAFSADVGQGQELDPVREKALATGASKVYIEDLREEFVRDYVFPMLRANAFYEHDYLLGTSIARPLIAKEQIRIAALEGADGVSHGSTGKGNDQVRFELAYHTLNPEIKIIAPWREWDLTSRTALIDYATAHGIPVPVTKDKPYSTDRNIFHISYEGGVLEDPWYEPHDDMFLLSVSPEQAPDKPTIIEISYEKGNPVAINGEKMSPAILLERLNEYGGANGIGRIDIVENRFVGMKSRGVYETPGGTILQQAHRGVESITLDREVMYLRDSLIPSYAKMVYNGFWFSPERELLQTMIDNSQLNVTGEVRLKLYKGNCTVIGRKAEKSLYNQNIASFEESHGYSQDDAEGFIKLNALRLKLYAETFNR
ncbi:MAG: argininosuccinate synthase [Nitrospinaceae bacterium]|nr:argininosuccinate synthase [Nitrospina sp.]MBT5375981.1 argininosuccinate synthase [Nitrospinaceae bacterium]